MIIPAIDILGGEAVRLYKGNYTEKTVYGNPLEMAKNFQRMGARYLHIVDLDGAKTGSPCNLEIIEQISEILPIQVGGGIRTAETVSRYLQITDRIILGTISVQNPAFVAEMIQTWGPEKILIGVDVRDGELATSGWLDSSGIAYLTFIETLKDMGVKTIVVTDILKDGTLTAPNWALYESIKGVDVIVSGGVSSNDHVVRGLNYAGVIIGKAYYEGKVDMEWLLANESSLVLI